MRPPALLSFVLLSLAVCRPGAAAQPSIRDLAQRGGELTFSFSAPVYFQVSRQPDELVLDLQNTSITPVADQLRSLEASWFDHLDVDTLFAGGYRLTFHLSGGTPPEVIGSSPGRTLVVVGERDENGRGRRRPRRGGPPASNSQNNVDQTPPGAPANGPVQIQSLKFATTDSGDLRLLIQATGPVQPHSFTLDDPPRRRLVIDFPGCVIQPPDQTLEAPENPWVTQVRTGMFEGRFPRVVLDLKCLVRHQLSLTSYPFGATVEVGNNESQPRVAVAPTTLGADQLPPATTDESAAPTDLKRLEGHTIVIDPGHGGFQPGAYAWGYNEKTLTLDIGLRVYRLLHEAGANVILTRNDDEDLTLSARANVANSNHAEAFVSIHLNAIDSSRKRSGTQTWFHFQNPICKAFASTMQTDVCQALGLPNLGIHSDSVRFRTGFGVLRESNPSMPAVLVEVGYLDCQQDFQQLCRPDFRERAARGICNGIADYLTGHTASAGSEASHAQ